MTLRITNPNNQLMTGVNFVDQFLPGLFVFNPPGPFPAVEVGCPNGVATSTSFMMSLTTDFSPLQVCT
jgi:hypothetical protein